MSHGWPSAHCCSSQVRPTSGTPQVWKREINPGRVFDLTLPLDQAADGYAAMDERRAIKALLWP